MNIFTRIKSFLFGNKKLVVVENELNDLKWTDHKGCYVPEELFNHYKKMIGRNNLDITRDYASLTSPFSCTIDLEGYNKVACSKIPSSEILECNEDKKTGSICRARISEREIPIAIKLNNKLVDTLMIKKEDINNAEMINDMVMKNEYVSRRIDYKNNLGKNIKKTIYVPGKTFNVIFEEDTYVFGDDVKCNDFEEEREIIEASNCTITKEDYNKAVYSKIPAKDVLYSTDRKPGAIRRAYLPEEPKNV